MSHRDRIRPFPDRVDHPPSSRAPGTPDDRPARGTGRRIGVVLSLEGRIYREGLSALLAGQTDFEVLGTTAAAGETVALCVTLQPDVLLVGMLGAWPRDRSPIAAVRLACPDTGILALAPHGRLVGGALGTVDGDVDPGTLFDALRAVARGERWGAGHARSSNGSGRALSPRERTVARLVGQGASNKEIADALAISSLTVKKHVSSIFQKLEVHDRLQLGLRVARDPMAFAGD
jgi:DNA-binding NarL/FixJ family response regulator